MDRTPLEVRDGDGYWSRTFDSPARQGVLDLIAARPQMFVKQGEAWHLRAACRQCKAPILFPLSGTLEEETIDGRHHPAAEFDLGMLSPAAVWVAQRAVCEPCGVKLDEEEAAKRKIDRLSARIKDSGIPRGLAAEVSWDSIVSTGSSSEETTKRQAAIDACREWAVKPKADRGVLLHGPSGTGKSRLAATAAMHRLQHSPVRWVSVSLLMAQLQAGWDDDDRKRALKVLTGKDSIVLDDLDKLNDRSPLVMSQIFAAIEAREQARVPIVVTTNKKPSELAKQLGEAVVSRLLGACNARPYPGPDRRLEFGKDAIEMEAGF